MYNKEYNSHYIKRFNLIVTMECNLDCKFCNSINNGKKLKDTSIKKIIKLLKKMEENDYQIENLKFFGGEPLLNYNFINRFYKEYSKNNFDPKFIKRFRTTTNGLTLNQEKINFLNKNNIRTNLSLDGNKKIYENNRGIKLSNKKWNNLLENIQSINQDLLFINIPISPNSAKSLSKNFKFITNFSKNINILPVFNKKWTKEQIINYFNEIKKLKKSKVFKNVYLENKENYSPIPLHNRGINIFPNGNIYNCSILLDKPNIKGFKIGKIESYKIKDIKKGLNYKNYKKEIQKSLESYGIENFNSINNYLEKGLLQLIY